MDLEKILPTNGPSNNEVKKYIEKYSDEIIVIKCGGSVLLDKNLFKQFIEDISVIKKLGLSTIVVHGGGKNIKKKLVNLNIESKFITDIGLGVITGNNTEMSTVYFTFKNSDSAKWYFTCEAGTFSNAHYNLNDDFSRFTKGSITRVFSQDWDMALTLSVEAFKGHDPMLGIGVVHGIIRGFDELLIP